jgi:uracil-DNA glycosylase
MSVANLTKEMYSEVERWQDFYKKGKTMRDIPFHPSWTVMFANIFKSDKFENIDKELKELIAKNRMIKIYPLPSYVFKAFSVTPATNLKVVFIGQDPYFNCEYHHDKHVPQAMGLSFSVPTGVTIPSSLDNIYSNMIKYGHIVGNKKPVSGNLWFWAYQGCLMLNTALTVEDSKKESHTRMWAWFTDYVIQYISDNMDNVVFVIWGAHAYKKINLIDLDRHHVVISSHPSGLSANKPFQNYPAFMNEDHFGKINQYLTQNGKTKILWN